MAITSLAAQLEVALREQCEINLPIVSDLMIDDVRAGMSRRTGASAESVTADPWVNEGTRYSTTLSAGRGLPEPEIVVWENDGTGIYGPDGRRIEAHDGGVLAFDWPVAGGIVFFKSVAGSPGRHFWDGMEERFAAACTAAWA